MIKLDKERFTMSAELVNQGTCFLGSLCPMFYGKTLPESLQTPFPGKCFMFFNLDSVLTVQRRRHSAKLIQYDIRNPSVRVPFQKTADFFCVASFRIYRGPNSFNPLK